MKRSTSVSLAVLALFVAVGCAKPPEDSIGAAQAELEKARPQAQTWAPTELRAADEAMSAAQAEVTAQNEKWIKNYDKAKELLNTAKENAAKAAEAAVANKEQARKDAESAIAAADTAVQTASAALKVAPVTKDSRTDLKLYKDDIGTLTATLEAARQSFASEDYKQAIESANSVKEQASSIAAKLEEARQKVAARRTGARS